MNKKIILAVVLLLIIGGAALYANLPKVSQDNNVVVGGMDSKNATYKINGVSVALKNGSSEIPVAPGSVSKITTTYFGNEVSHDFDGDGRMDVAFLLTQNTGGSGTFYYVVIALNTVNGYVGSDALLLGDRIAPQSTSMGKGNIVIVNYADRKPGESFAIQPSVGKSIWVLLDPKTMTLGEVAQDFEGEADTSKMNLGMKSWIWEHTSFGDGVEEFSPKATSKFTLTFSSNKTFSVETDCNSGGGEYITSGNTLSLTKMISTQMYCEGSQEGIYTKELADVKGFHFTSKGELLLDLKTDSGVMTFR